MWVYNISTGWENVIYTVCYMQERKKEERQTDILEWLAIYEWPSKEIFIYLFVCLLTFTFTVMFYRFIQSNLEKRLKEPTRVLVVLFCFVLFCFVLFCLPAGANWILLTSKTLVPTRLPNYLNQQYHPAIFFVGDQHGWVGPVSRPSLNQSGNLWFFSRGHHSSIIYYK